MRPWSLSVITDLVPRALFQEKRLGDEVGREVMNNDTCSWTMALLSVDNIHFTLERA